MTPARLKRGSILRVIRRPANPLKGEHVAIVCNDPLIIFCINSRPTEFQRARQHLMDSQLLLDNADYDFLSQRAYLDCTENVARGAWDSRADLVKDVEEIPGSLTRDTITQLLRIVQDSQVLSPREKHCILDSFS